MKVREIKTVQNLFFSVLGKLHLVSVLKILRVWSNEPRAVVVLADVEVAGIVWCA